MGTKNRALYCIFDAHKARAMTISYNWLSEYLPRTIDPEVLSGILTSIGLEVESLTPYESIKGGLKGVLIGEVLTCEQHPNADKLKVTTVNIGAEAPIQVVCGASNVAAGQKVLVATVGTTIYPTGGEPLTMKVAKIRGTESFGMICAEDELGLGTSHEGIMVLPATAIPGEPAASLFEPYSDWIYEIGLTPNRMDAMSHLGVARDVCAYLSHHEQEAKVVSPLQVSLPASTTPAPVSVQIEAKEACERYAGVCITGVTVQESPAWLKNRLMAIGQRPINNIVDITNYILHETGQPLHAFDLQAVGKQVNVRCLPEGTPFTTLDGVERKLGAEDLMICNATEGMCIAGVFGGAKSGVTTATQGIFLESAWFHPVSIRKTSVKQGLRTEAATRFEKGVDISATVNVLQRAALLIQQVAGGVIEGSVIDVYPAPKPKQTVSVSYAYIRKLGGKDYAPATVKQILTSLGFELLLETADEITLAVPYNKPDISLPADIVEEVIRIDGLDNIAIPSTITITPAVEQLGKKEALKEKIAQYLAGRGFVEILTNSITNSQYFSEEVLSHTVKMMNNLSAELDVLRPSMLETGLETVAYNLNRKNLSLQLFEFGKTYAISSEGKYVEEEQLCLYLTGKVQEDTWLEQARAMDIFYAKGITAHILQSAGITGVHFKQEESGVLQILHGQRLLGSILEVGKQKAAMFDIKQPVFYVNIPFLALQKAALSKSIVYKEVSRFPAVQRDLALVLNKDVQYAAIEAAVATVKLPKLQSIRLFDIFESDKLGEGKKSMAINFTFMDEEKTLTDKETDAMMTKLTQAFEQQLGAEIRK